MSAVKIDYNRGVIKRRLQKAGLDIYMYHDQPGVYLNAFGVEVTPSLAKEAGFDVEVDQKAKLKRDRQKAAMDAIENELAGDPSKTRELLERGGFKVIDIGLGRHNVLDPDGNVLNSIPLPFEQAKLLLEALVKTGETTIIENAPDDDDA